MALDKLRTASGRRLRGEALTETALPVQYDAAAMPGAIVLGTDGRLYGSVRNPASAPLRMAKPTGQRHGSGGCNRKYQNQRYLHRCKT